jgi:hypothetical protein
MGRRQRKQRRLERLRYEDAVAWLVVPVVLVALTYGALEISRQLVGTPIGKMLGLE